MSYCRFNEDSDVYCYYTGETWVIHVANYRDKLDIEQVKVRDFIRTGPCGPAPPEHSQIMEGAELEWKAWSAFHAYMCKLFAGKYKEDISPPYGGKTYNCSSRVEFYSTLEKIRDSGILVPQRAFDRILEEADREGD